MRNKAAYFSALFLAMMARGQSAATPPFLSDRATVYDRQIATAYTGMQLAARRAPSNNKYVTMGANVSTGGEVDITVMPLGGAYVGTAAAAPAGLGSAPPPANSILDQPGMTLISPLQP
jgi:hypothetical protein